MDMKSRCCYIGLEMAHHAGASGYHHIADSDADYISNEDAQGIPRRMLLRIFRRLYEKSDSKWYNRQALNAELTVMRRMFTHSQQVFHFLYGENNFRYSGLAHRLSQKRGNKLVATYHTPAWRLKELTLDREHLKYLDGIVVVSTSQIPFYEELSPHAKVSFIPHGIDTDYFRPDRSKIVTTGPFKLICVGHHLRDYDVLRRVAQRALEKRLPVEFNVIARSDRTKPFEGLKNIKLQSGLSDLELLHAYQSSHALILPLRDATANNTLLEGMACGLPIISTDIVGVRDYVDVEHAMLASPEDDEHLLELVTQTINSDCNLARMSAASRQRALELDWAQVRSQLTSSYAQL